jgi:hypothetical protein
MDHTTLPILKGFLLSLQEKHASLATPVMCVPFVIAQNELAIHKIETEGYFVGLDSVMQTNKKELADKVSALKNADLQLWTKCDDNYYVMKQYEYMIDCVKRAIWKKQNVFQRIMSFFTR